jgi:bacterial/archaeal transporter family-2 protein
MVSLRPTAGHSLKVIAVPEACEQHQGTSTWWLDMLSTVQWLALAALGLIAGLSFVMQQIVNTHLKSGLASPLWAAFVSYAGGTLLVALFLLATQEGLPSRQAVAGTSWPSWLGGAFGLVYVLASIALLPRVGAATSIALIVAGEMLTSLTFDHFGLMGLTKHPIGTIRVLGAMMLLAGVVLIRK